MTGGPHQDWLKNPAAGAAAVVAVFGAVGIAGDFLPRLARNEPVWTIVLTALAVISVFVLLLDEQPGLAVGSTLLCASLVGVIVLGVVSHSDREVPQVSLSSTSDVAGDTAVVQVTASATSLRSQETMQVQVLGFPQELGPIRLDRECTSSRRSDDPEKPELAVLSWDESGPDQAGNSSVEVTLHLPPNSYAQLCVGVFLRDRDTHTTRDDRYAWTYTTIA